MIVDRLKDIWEDEPMDLAFMFLMFALGTAVLALIAAIIVGVLASVFGSDPVCEVPQ